MVSYIHARGEASLQQHPSKIGKIPNFASRDVRLFIIFVGSIIGRLIQARIANAPKISVSVQPVEVFNNRGRSVGMRKSILLYNSGEDAHNVWCHTKINGKEKRNRDIKIYRR